MKTYKHLYPQLVAVDNIYDDWHKAWRGKRYTVTGPQISVWQV